MGSVGAAGAVFVTKPTWDKGNVASASTNQPSTVHMLGREPDGASQKLARLLADDVFDRLCQSVKGRSLTVTTLQRMGETDRRRGFTMMNQWNCAFCLSSEYLVDEPPPFDMQRFRVKTAAWENGNMGTMPKFQSDKPPDGATPTDEAFKDVVAVGQLPIHSSMDWAAHYVDEATGMFMRVVMVYEISYDNYVIRFDVLCG